MSSRTKVLPRPARPLPEESSIRPPEDGLIEDFVTFSDEMIYSKDIDPVYPILAETYDSLDLEDESRLWFTFLYMAYHMLPSATAAFERHPKPGPLDGDMLKLPMMMQRRNLRGGKLQSHVASYLRAIEGSSQDSWIRNGFRAGEAMREYNFEAFWLTSQSVWGNGRLAAYKWAEILEYVHGYQMRAPDMRLKDCLGPRRGVELVYDMLGAPTAPLNIAGDDVKYRLQEGLGRELRWAEVETCLCDFAAMLQGRFYVGHDIDEIQEQITDYASRTVWKRQRVPSILFQAREGAIPHEYLGELMGWQGRDDKLKRSYRTDGLIQSRRGVLGKRKAGEVKAVSRLAAERRRTRLAGVRHRRGGR
jgi:Alpha-glutamyl/putrescinyl thymine pyrophosphorylase clade 2